ncbi:DNA methyltransferase [Mesonia sp. K4-1]|uniref:class I SAM-dependent DNA methyltransferase n=1 Tax=Mesonia sp. K4-1 TaxID=2602760 RepID=UPI001C9D29AA|nr:DNA methyltransferase [Mesonia sp. K4-1]
MNHFLARLIFCFFAEDTDIFKDDNLFTDTIQKISDPDASNTHEVISEIFRAMDTKLENREKENIKVWGKKFPYVNGELFSGSTEVPKFTKIARSYLLHVGSLDWKQINPDIFGSMIQAVADEDERGSLGMHYTSVPNIRKVLNPLFLDDLREQLEKAGDNKRKLLNLRNRMARIRVFDPACGSGNFLVIAYKDMRKIENDINIKRGETNKASEIPLTNFRGIELKGFSAEVARLALIIAEYQCDVLYRGQRLALAEFLPLDAENWIVKGNALTLNWFTVCPPEGIGVKLQGDDLFSTPLEQAQIDFDNAGGETYICGNPPYLGSTWQSKEQKGDLESVFKNFTKTFKILDYVSGWFMKAALYSKNTNTAFAFVSTDSICQGQQVPFLWPLILKTGNKINFAYNSFKWQNLASHNAGVMVIIVGLSNKPNSQCVLFQSDENEETFQKYVPEINPYLVAGPSVIVEKAMKPINGLSKMDFGNKADDGGHLTLTSTELDNLSLTEKEKTKFIKRFFGSKELIRGETRYCIWIDNKDLVEAEKIQGLSNQIEKVRKARLSSKDKYAQSLAVRSHQFKTPRAAKKSVIVTPRVSSGDRPFLPVDYMNNKAIIGDRNFALYDSSLWHMALIASRLHWVWIGKVCVRLGTGFSYSNTLGWNTFPIPMLTKKNKEDLTATAEEILIARERHFPATIAELYNPEKMPKDLRLAHERNDEVLERIYIGRKFKNDTERLEKLFELYTKMTSKK